MVIVYVGQHVYYAIPFEKWFELLEVHTLLTGFELTRHKYTEERKWWVGVCLPKNMNTMCVT